VWGTDQLLLLDRTNAYALDNFPFFFFKKKKKKKTYSFVYLSALILIFLSLEPQNPYSQPLRYRIEVEI
jgi:DNA phosphorothioation-dependent restriction protein DptG